MSAFIICLAGGIISKQRSTHQRANDGFVPKKKHGKEAGEDRVNKKDQPNLYGGRSREAKTDAGRKRCTAAKTIHGRETREKRELRAKTLRELRELERLLKLKGLRI